MKGILKQVHQSEEFQSIITGVEEQLSEQLVAGLSGSSRTAYIADVYLQTNKSTIVVTHNLFQAQKIYDDLIQFLSEDEVYLYSANELIAAELSVASPELRAQRIEVLNKLSQNHKGVYIVPVAGLQKDPSSQSNVGNESDPFSIG